MPSAGNEEKPTHVHLPACACSLFAQYIKCEMTRKRHFCGSDFINHIFHTLANLPVKEQLQQRAPGIVFLVFGRTRGNFAWRTHRAEHNCNGHWIQMAKDQRNESQTKQRDSPARATASSLNDARLLTTTRELAFSSNHQTLVQTRQCANKGPHLLLELVLAVTQPAGNLLTIEAHSVTVPSIRDGVYDEEHPVGTPGFHDLSLDPLTSEELGRLHCVLRFSSNSCCCRSVSRQD